MRMLGGLARYGRVDAAAAAAAAADDDDVHALIYVVVMHCAHPARQFTARTVH